MQAYPFDELSIRKCYRRETGVKGYTLTPLRVCDKRTLVRRSRTLRSCVSDNGMLSKSGYLRLISAKVHEIG